MLKYDYMHIKPVVIGADHRGYELKEYLLQTSPFYMEDLGCFSNETCDYPDIVAIMATKIIQFGVLICNTGIGMSISANSYPNLAAALCLNQDMASTSRKHNNANILVIPTKYISNEEALELLKIFIATDYDNSPRYNQRLKKINKTY